MIEKKDRPDYKSKAHQAMASRWCVVTDALGGTLELRSDEKRRKYLPQFPAEDNDVYKDRADTAVFYNAPAKTLAGVVGLIFQKSPTLNSDVSEEIKTHLENVDNEGTHWQVFAKEVEEFAWEHGHAIILVDMPPTLPEGSTREDEVASGRRPYWVKYKASQVMSWEPLKANGKKALGRITFEEISTERDGLYGEKEVCRYRTFRVVNEEGQPTRVSWLLERKSKNTNSGEEIFEEEGKGFLENIDEIPIAVAYARKKGFLESSPPLLDQTVLAIKHFQIQSEQDNTLHITGFPMLWTDDRSADIKTVGPALMITVAKSCTVGYAEPDGNSLEHQRERLKELKLEMAMMGLSFIAERVKVEQTATETVIDNAQEKSELATSARSLKDAIELCLDFHNRFLRGKPRTGGTIDMVDFNALVLSAEEERLLSDQVSRGQHSLETLWEFKRRRGSLPADFDPQKEKDLIGELQPAF